MAKFATLYHGNADELLEILESNEPLSEHEMRAALTNVVLQLRNMRDSFGGHMKWHLKHNTPEGK